MTARLFRRGRLTRPYAVAMTALGLALALLGLGTVPAPWQGGADDVASTSTSDPDDTGTATEWPTSTQQNIVFILTDDLSSDLVQYMPEVQKLQDEGLTFSNYIVNNSLCCPSRAAMLTGQYGHTTGIYTNHGAEGGYVKFSGDEQDLSTFGTDLKAAGYTTGFLGKYLNEYMTKLASEEIRSTVPAGWDTWFAAGDAYRSYNYKASDNGQIVKYGKDESDYMTDVLAERAVDFIEEQEDSSSPFVLEVSTYAPHSPYVPPKRYENVLKNLKAPQDASYGKENVNPVPYLTGRKAITAEQQAEYDEAYRDRVRSVMAVDDLMADVRETLEATGQLDNTVIIFASDNGYHIGQHRLGAGKLTPFDTDINVPLVMSGPGVPQGTTDILAQNVDIRSTLDAIGHTVPGEEVDGQALLPLPEAGDTWRSAALVEHHGPDIVLGDPDYQPAKVGNPPSHFALRFADYIYIEYLNGRIEYYDLVKDPAETTNIADTLDAETRQRLHRMVLSAQSCRGSVACATALGATAVTADEVLHD